MSDEAQLGRTLVETAPTAGRRLRRRAWEILESLNPRDVPARCCQIFIIGLILANVAAVLASTEESLAARYGPLFEGFELFSVVVFTVEYLARLWTAPEDPQHRYRHPVLGRLRYGLSFFALVDLAAILPFYLAFMIPLDLRVLRALRMLRALKLTRYSAAVETLATVFYNERRALAASFLIMLVLLVVSSSLVYLAEHGAQPKAFSSIPAAMWWGLATLTTVGYGDVVPVTALGRLIGGFVTVLGVAMFALPAGILASGFAQEIRRRDFVVTWNLVASVPFFAELPAPRIADIAALLKPWSAVPGEIIVKEGEKADSMYFLAAGEVEVELRRRPVRLSAGSFFGEMALIEKRPRAATVVARTNCKLLVLGARDFENLAEDHPDLYDAIASVARDRAGTPPSQGAAAAADHCPHCGQPMPKV